MQHKLQFNSLKIILITGLLFLEGLCFAQAPDQNVNSKESLTTNPTVDSDKESQEVHSPQEDHDTQDLEALLKRYNTDQETILNDADKLHGDSGANVVHESELDEMPHSEDQIDSGKKDALTQVYEKGMKSRKKSEIIPTDLSNSVRFALLPIQRLSEAELLKRLHEGTKDSVIKPYLNEFPNLTIFTVRLLKDAESIPSLVKILEDKERLIWFASAMLTTFIIGFLLKRFMHREGRSFLKATLYFFIRLYVMLGIRIAIVYYFYSVEFTPAARVFKATFM